MRGVWGDFDLKTVDYGFTGSYLVLEIDKVRHPDQYILDYIYVLWIEQNSPENEDTVDIPILGSIFAVKFCKCDMGLALGTVTACVHTFI